MGLSVARRAGERCDGSVLASAGEPLALATMTATATLEVTLIGPADAIRGDTAFAVTGASFDLTLDDTTDRR